MAPDNGVPHPVDRNLKVEKDTDLLNKKAWRQNLITIL
jgi:hypothetical protein